MSRLIAATIATLLAASTPAAAANAQGAPIHYDWGGSSEWGGGKQLVSFSPSFKPGQIVVSFGDRRLYHVVKSGQAMSYPIAIPREQSRWEGTTSVSQKRENPSWTPTPDMLRENPRLPAWVPGGHPMNPLGVRALYLGSSMYRIHGTDAPWTIGQAVSKGCIRMFNEDVIDLYPKINVGATVLVTWQRFKTGPGEAPAESEAKEQAAGRVPAATERRTTIPPRRLARSASAAPKADESRTFADLAFSSGD